MNRKYAIFGCTADPFTPAHGAIVKAAAQFPGVDKVFIIPTAVDYHRGDKVPWLGDSEKIQAIRAVMDGFDETKWEIWDKEIRLKSICAVFPNLRDRLSGNHRFIDTLIDFKLEHPECVRPYVIIGADQAVNFGNWAAYEEILKLAQMLVVPSNSRASCDNIPEWLNYEILRIDAKFDGMSASEFREKYREAGVDAYINEVIIPITHEKQLLHTPIFDVVAAPEVEAGFRPVKVKAPDWVTIIVENGEKGQVLVERQLRYGNNCEVAEFPCGMVEPGEEPKTAALRELHEETGIIIQNPSCMLKLGSVSPNPAFMMNTMHYFYVNLDVAKFTQLEQKLDEHEKISLEWRDTEKFFEETVRSAANGGNQTPALLLAAMQMYRAWQSDPVGLTKSGDDETELDSDKMMAMSTMLHFDKPQPPGKSR